MKKGVKEFFAKSQETTIFRKIYDKNYKDCDLSYTVLQRFKILKFEITGSCLISSFSFANVFACSVIPISRSTYFISKEIFSLNLGKLFFKFDFFN